MMVTLPDVAAYWAAVLTPAAVGTAFEANVWRGSLAPQGARLPYLLYFLVAGEDDRCLDGGSWAGLDAEYMVMGVTLAADYVSPFGPALAAIQAALEAEVLQDRVRGSWRYTLQESGGLREYEEVLPSGAIEIHSGRRWRLAVDPT